LNLWNKRPFATVAFQTKADIAKFISALCSGAADTFVGVHRPMSDHIMMHAMRAARDAHHNEYVASTTRNPRNGAQVCYLSSIHGFIKC
jgi:hypothetical protein